MADKSTEILLRVSTDVAELKKLVSGFDDAKKKLRETKDEADSLGASLKKGASLFLGFEAARQAKDLMVGFFRDSIIAGVRFNAVLETSTLGVASVLKTFNPEKYQEFGDAIRKSTSLIDDLKKAAVESPATFEELLTAYQGTAGAMTRANIPLAKQVQLVNTASIAMTALGIHTQELRQELTALTDGRIDRNSRLANTLGITAEDITRAKAQGQLLEFLTDKMKVFAEAGKVGTQNIQVLKSNLTDAQTQVAAESTRELSEAYRELLISLTALIKSDSFKGTLQTLASIATGAVNTVTAITDSLNSGPNLKAHTDKIDSDIDDKDITTREQADLARKRLQIVLESIRREEAELKNRPDSLTVMAGLGSFKVDRKDLQAGELAALTQRRVEIEERIANLNKRGDSLVTKNAAEAAEDAVLQKAKLITEEVKKQVSEYEKEIAASRFTLAANEDKLKILDAILDKAQQQHTLELAASYTANDREARNAANLKFEAERLSIEEKRGAVLKAIAADQKKQADAEAAIIEKRKQAELEIARSRINLAKNQLEDRQRGIQGNLAALNGDFTRTDAEKWGERKRLMSESVAVAQEYLDKMKEIRGGTTTEAGRQLGDQNVRSAAGDLSNAQNNVAGLGADPNSFGESMKAQVTQLREGFATAAQTVTGVLQASIDGLAGSMAGLLNRTMSWGDALRNIGGSVINSVINGISRMFAEWIVGIIAKSAAEKAAAIAEIAAKTPGALLTSISSFGTAAAVGVAALVAAMALTGGFAQGGYTGAGGVNEYAGPAHKGEVVFSQKDIARNGGVAAVEAMRVSGGFSTRGAGVSASTASGGAGGPAIGSGGAPVVNQAYFNTKQDAEQWLASQSGRRIMTDFMRNQSYDL